MSSLMRCRLCGDQLTYGYFSKTWKDPHYRTFHAEYAEWLGRWIRNFVIIGTIDAAVLVIVLILIYKYWALDPAMQLTLGIAALLLYLVPVWVPLIQHLQRVAFFKKQWAAQHPFQKHP